MATIQETGSRLNESALNPWRNEYTVLIILDPPAEDQKPDSEESPGP